MIALLEHPVPSALIMAGGEGRRMARTHRTPKPLVAVLGVPLLEINLRKCLRAGFRPVTIALGHAADAIIAHVRSCGDLPGAEVQFAVEPRPLGTAGALGLLAPPSETRLLTNGDLLSGIDLGSMLAFHRHAHADLTIAVHFESHRLQLGEVVTADDLRVRDYLEKPTKQYRISSGTYLLEPVVHDLVAAGTRVDVPDLVRAAVHRRLNVLVYAHGQEWIDVNDAVSLARAEEMLRRDPECFGVTRASLQPQGSSP
ncbi:MAG: sugar phosphate nucleotidyltransferase [Planctomycetota bacterium]